MDRFEGPLRSGFLRNERPGPKRPDQQEVKNGPFRLSHNVDPVVVKPDTMSEFVPGRARRLRVSDGLRV
jgi:hypothetical protein